MVSILSIIIICKNEQDFLPKLLESIKKQEFKDYEIIVSDANSTDKTREIAVSYGCKVIDGGLPSVGRNNGAKVANGELLLFLDADTILPDDFLSKNIEEMERRKLSAAIPIIIPLSSKLIDHFLCGFYNKLAWFCQIFFPLAGGFCIFCKRDIFDKVNGFDEKVVMSEDHDFVRRTGKIGKFRVLKSVPCLNDVRRLEKEGRFKLVAKYLYGAYYYLFRGNMYKFPFDYELQGGVNLKNDVIIYKQKVYYNSFFLKVVRLITPIILKLYKVRIENGKNDKIPNNPILIACHHETKMDQFIINKVLGKRLFWVADTSHNVSLADTKIRKFFMRRVGVIPIDKRNPKRNKNLFEYIHYLLRSNESIVFFPEGCIKEERNNEKFGEFKNGVVRCALEYESRHNKKVPILPIGINYKKEVAKVNIGELFYPNSIENSEELFEEIRRLSKC